METQAAPGWYDWQGDATRQRYFDGQQWTDEWRDRAGTGLVVAGYLGALLMGVFGAIIGVILIVKNRVGHGIAVLTLSMLGVAIVFMLMLVDSL